MDRVPNLATTELRHLRRDANNGATLDAFILIPDLHNIVHNGRV